MASYTKEELLSVAKGRQLIARAQPVQDDHQFISTVIDEEPADNDDMVMSERWKARILKTLGLPDSDATGPEIIEQCLSGFKANTVSELMKIDDDDYSILNYTANGAPLLDHIRYRISQLPWWETHLKHIVDDLSENRLIDSESKINIKEITIGQSSSLDIKEFISFMKEGFQSDIDKFPYSVDLMADITEISLFCSESQVSSKIPLTPMSDSRSEVSTKMICNIPASLIIGGSDFVGVIRLPIDIETKGRMKYYTYRSDLKAKSSLINYMNEIMPNLVGFNIKDKLSRFQNVVNANHTDGLDVELEFTDYFLDVKYLGYTAGVINTSSIDSLLLLCTGGVISNSIVNKMTDINPALHISHQSNAVQLYLVGAIRAIFNIYSCFKISLLLDAFPDLVAACQASRLQPYEVIIWFGSLVSAMIRGREGDSLKAKLAHSRYDLMLSVKSGGSGFALPISVDKFVHLISSGPSLVFGGPRFLHQARMSVATFSRSVNQMKIPFVDVVWKSLDVESLKNTVLLHQFEPDDDINIWKSNSVPVSGTAGLLLHPNIKYPDDPLMKLDPRPEGTSKTEFLQLKRNTGRPFRTRMIEWALLNPEKILGFLKRAALQPMDDMKYMLPNTSVMDTVKSIYTIIFDKVSKIEKPQMSAAKQIRENLVKIENLQSSSNGLKRKAEKLAEIADQADAKRIHLEKEAVISINSLAEKAGQSECIKQIFNPEVKVKPQFSNKDDSGVKLSKGQRKRMNKKLRLGEIAKDVKKKFGFE